MAREWIAYNKEDRMTKKDFITRLRRALSGKLDGMAVTEHASYYEEYIEIQVRKGKEEWQVTEELGDPALLAKSILNAERDSRTHLNEAKLFALGTYMKSICLDFGQKIKQKAKDWFESLR